MYNYKQNRSLANPEKREKRKKCTDSVQKVATNIIACVRMKIVSNTHSPKSDQQNG